MNQGGGFLSKLLRKMKRYGQDTMSDTTEEWIYTKDEDFIRTMTLQEFRSETNQLLIQATGLTLLEFPEEMNVDGFWEEQPNGLGVERAVQEGMSYYEDMVAVAGMLSMTGGPY